MARPAHSNGFGKCDAELRIAIDETTKDALIALAVLSDVPVAEYIRGVLHIHVHGHLAVVRAHRKGEE